MTRLSVNINKIATLRNARGGNTPDLLKAARRIEEYGAEGITVHPRPDERHIRYSDVMALKNVVQTELNVEGFPNPKFIKLIQEVCPDQVTLVPDSPEVLTSNAGWDTEKNENFLFDVISTLKKIGCRISLFMENNHEHIRKAKELGADRIELYTESYASAFSENKEMAVLPFKEAARFALSIDLELNAGHDLNLDNLHYFISEIPEINEVSIGHALISDALYFGLENTVNMYKKELQIHETQF
ncbi:MAG: pyridoxine 5'-phosphate synthase [Bacteroidota bacterium]